MQSTGILAHLLVGALVGTRSAAGASGSASTSPFPEVRSGALRVAFGQGGTYTLTVDGEQLARSAPLSVFVDGAQHTVANGGLHCAATWEHEPAGTDNFGEFSSGARLACEAGAVPVVFSWRAYVGRTLQEGKLLATLLLPAGANGTAAQGQFSVHETSPVQFAPFPAWVVEGVLNTSAFLCYGGDKSHLFSAHAYSAGGTGLSGAATTCFQLGNGPATLLWPGSKVSEQQSRGMQALVAGPASAFHLNYHRVIGDEAPGMQLLTAKLWWNAARGSVTLCLSALCDTTQKNSGYVVLSADEGTVNPASIPPPGMPGGKSGLSVPLYFSWSQANLDNWVTTSPTCPGPSYCSNFGNKDGFIYAASGKGRIPLQSFATPNGTHHMAAATNKSKAWAVSHGYIAKGVLGYVDAPIVAPADLCAMHIGTDYVCCDLKQVNVSSPSECCSACQAEGTECSAWKTTRNGGTCYLKTGVLSNPTKVGDDVVVGYRHPPPGGSNPAGAKDTAWGFGVSGDVLSVPPGFTQSTLLVHSGLGANDAWDEWGATMRSAYDTKKDADQDIFLAALSIFTDNGAATLGAAWAARPGTVPPPVAPGPVGPDAHDLGPNVGYMNWNWSMVSEAVLGRVADSVRGTGVAPRGTQLDCWWYPVQTGGAAPGSKHPDWCVSDWVLPEEFYPNGTGGVRRRMGTPLMLYFPNLCVENAWNKGGKYTWSDTAAESGFVLPIANQSERFWNDMYDYGSMLAANSVDVESTPWPGIWAPEQVVAGWQGTNLAAYETDFYHNIVSVTPELRQVFGAGEQFLGGIDRACASHNMTAQLCAGNPPSFLEALTMPRITNARASIDYDWDGDPTQNSGPRSNNGAHNWAAADNGWVFWATRIAPSKDNFWTSFRDLYKDGGGQDSGRNGKDAELHAVVALLTTGPVGLGDTCVGVECMVNSTLVHRLARADGILLRPDRPLAPVDVMFGGLLGDDVRSMPGLCTVTQERGPDASNASCGARLWQTHATVFSENSSKAPELATAPTRVLVSHGGVDATEQRSVPAALAHVGSARHLLQHLVVSVDQPNSFQLQPIDLYPLPVNTSGVPVQIFWRSAADGGKPCVAGTDAVASGCVGLTRPVDLDAPLFDVPSPIRCYLEH